MKHELTFGGMVGGALGLFVLASGAPAPLAATVAGAAATAAGLFTNRMLHLDEYRAAASCTPRRYDPLTKHAEAQPERRPLPPPMRRPEPAQPLDAAAYCTPRRYDSLTAMPKPHPVTVEQVQVVAAIISAKQVREQTAEPELQPIAVPDWPMPAVVEDVPAVVTVNRTAARFAALELRGDNNGN
jgi:hypothetical protein